MRTKNEALQYVVDYVAAGAKFIKETKDGYIFEVVEAWDLKDGTQIKIFKSDNIREDDYKVMQRKQKAVEAPAPDESPLAYEEEVNPFGPDESDGTDPFEDSKQGVTFTVQLVDKLGIIAREVEWLTQDGAEMQAQVWSACFPDNFVFINGEKVYNGGWRSEV